MKTLVLYLYREDPATKPNLDFFVRFGVRNCAETDYVLLVNDHTCTVDLPNFSNFHVIKKENSYDLNSYWLGLQKLGSKNYDYFIFLNSSCIGPFVPAYIDKPWDKVITEQLNEKVKLIGPIVEIPRDNLGATCLKKHKYIKAEDKDVPFIHTYFFATDRVGLKVLTDYDVLSSDTLTKVELIGIYERLVTSAVINEGYEPKSFLYKFRTVKLADKSNWNSSLWSNTELTCPEVPCNYDGTDVSPLELVFVKNLRVAHSFRSEEESGLSMALEVQLDRYIGWDNSTTNTGDRHPPLAHAVSKKSTGFLEVNDLRLQVLDLKKRLGIEKEILARVYSSRSWKITAPLRWVLHRLNALK